MWKTDKRGHLANFNGEKWRLVVLFRLLFEGLDGFFILTFSILGAFMHLPHAMCGQWRFPVLARATGGRRGQRRQKRERLQEKSVPPGALSKEVLGRWFWGAMALR